MTPLSRLPCVFLSYREPNADANYEHLCQTHPFPDNIVRVHGVQGFDTAHKVAALVSWAPKFVMFDGDTRATIPDDFYKLTLETLEMKADDSDGTSMCFSSLVSTLATPDLRAGLTYGNGGLKVWSRRQVLKMLTHENSQIDTTDVEFCYEPWYRHSQWVYSVTVVNDTPFQAFRAGLREGFKLSGIENFAAAYERMNTILTAWMTMSADVQNGRFSMMGARIGYMLQHVPEFDGFRNFVPATVVNDEDCCKALFNRLVTERQIVADAEKWLLHCDARRFKIRTADEATAFKSQYPV